MILSTPKIRIAAVMDFYIYVKNEPYTGYSSWDINVTKISLATYGYACSCQPKIKWSVCTLNGCLPTCKNQIYTSYSF